MSYLFNITVSMLAEYRIRWRRTSIVLEFRLFLPVTVYSQESLVSLARDITLSVLFLLLRQPAYKSRYTYVARIDTY